MPLGNKIVKWCIYRNCKKQNKPQQTKQNKPGRIENRSWYIRKDFRDVENRNPYYAMRS